MASIKDAEDGGGDILGVEDLLGDIQGRLPRHIRPTPEASKTLINILGDFVAGNYDGLTAKDLCYQLAKMMDRP